MSLCMCMLCVCVCVSVCVRCKVGEEPGGRLSEGVTLDSLSVPVTGNTFFCVCVCVLLCACVSVEK